MNVNNAKSIEIDDKDYFDKYLQKFPPEISELTFTNLYIWKDFYEFNFVERNEHLIIFSKTFLKKWWKPINECSNCLFFLPPIGPTPELIILELFESLKNLEIHRTPNDITNKIETHKKFERLDLKILHDRNSWDYVYEKEALINLSGNKYRQKRRLLKKFKMQYDYEFNIIDKALIDKTYELQLEWCDQNECQRNIDLKQEQNAIKNALDFYDELGLSGGILCVENKCVGYTLGEMLNKDMVVIHIEKAHIDYEGSYQAINNFFLKNCCKKAKFVNREQDLGIPGLRKAKESYNPIRMVEKNVIYRNLSEND